MRMLNPSSWNLFGTSASPQTRPPDAATATVPAHHVDRMEPRRPLPGGLSSSAPGRTPDANPNGGLLSFLYETQLGRLVRPALSLPWASSLAGAYMDTALSAAHIPAFIEQYGIDMNDFARKSPDEYASFNDFFCRELAPGRRPIATAPDAVASPADSRVLVIPNISDEHEFLVKDKPFDLQAFLRDTDLADELTGGTMMIFRLRPDDYHRFHFPIEGRIGAPRRIPGKLESVDPIAYESGIVPLTCNERHLMVLDRPNGSRVAIVPVGAMAVGKIVETYDPNTDIGKGDECGLFKFGGSTVVVVFPPGEIAARDDLVEASASGTETYVKMGEQVAQLVLHDANTAVS